MVGFMLMLPGPAISGRGIEAHEKSIEEGLGRTEKAVVKLKKEKKYPRNVSMK